MQEILRHLSSNNIVIDLGCQNGSFSSAITPARVLRVDRDCSSHLPDAASQFIQADASALPFRADSIAAVISNHSLEHFENLAESLDEIGRVLGSNAALFVAVPDATTLTDVLYRWLSRGGGHVNPFCSPKETAQFIETHVGLPLVATRLLCSSLSFMNRRNSPGPRPRRLALVGGGYEWTLFLYTWLSRRFDRLLGSRTRVYGWAFFFGKVDDVVDTKSWVKSRPPDLVKPLALLAPRLR
ncbi:MAG: class I SAM-dependent methyltransferase [Acidobacteriota bacterium]|nr:class I SAM-dependent methyltransferase [Acidobacteriota bacterium]